MAKTMSKQKKHWYDYLWIVTPIYLGLGFFNILFAWIGLIFFFLPLILSAAGFGKLYCNLYCDRGRFLDLLGKKLHLSRNKKTPKWVSSPIFRYGFLIFFLVMFMQMLFNTYLVFSSAKDLSETVRLFWTFNVPWHWAYNTQVTPWVAQFAFGFYSIMLTSTLIGIIFTVLFKPRSWCVFCPMGTMTQLICRIRAPKSEKQ